MKLLKFQKLKPESWKKETKSSLRQTTEKKIQKLCFRCLPLTIKKLPFKFCEISCIFDEVIKVSNNLSQIQKTTFNQKKSQIYDQNTEKLKITVSKFCFGCPPLATKKLLRVCVQFYEILCTFDEVVLVSKTLSKC